MTARRSLCALLVTLTLTASALASESYVCITEMTTGFNFDAKADRWKNAVFRSEKKIAITRAVKKPYAWEAKEVGDTRPSATCEQDFNDAGNLFCSGIFDLRFNKRHLRFLYVYPIGYWSDDKASPTTREGVNTPAMAIGTCRAL